jgi:hypothetical protein
VLEDGLDELSASKGRREREVTLQDPHKGREKKRKRKEEEGGAKAGFRLCAVSFEVTKK